MTALLDFGASVSLINASLLKPNECHPYRVEAEDSRGVKRTHEKAAWLEVRLGGLNLGKVRFIVLDLDSIKPKSFGKLDLILGVDVFKSHRVGFNLRENHFLTHPIEKATLDLQLEWTQDNLPAIHGAINGCKCLWLLDTGSKFPSTIPKSLSQCASQVEGPIDSYKGLNSATTSVRSTLRNVLVLGGQRWADQTVWIDEGSDPTLGLGLFKDCEVEFDFPAGRFRVKRLPSAATESPSPASLP